MLAGKLLGIVSVMRGYEPLHASAVDSPQGPIALVGPSGVGKSTLARELAGRGWALFTDDTLPLLLGPAGVRHTYEKPQLIDYGSLQDLTAGCLGATGGTG